MKLGRYRKLWAAMLGIGLLLGLRYAGIELPGLGPHITDMIVGAFTVIGVERVPNDA